MRRLVGLLIVLVLFVLADSAARSYASDQIESRLSSALNLQGEVKIGGFPFLWGVLRGRFEDITVTAGNVGSDALQLSKVQLVLKDVSFPVGEALSGRLDELEVRSAQGRARISAPALESALSGLPVDLRSLPSGKLDISSNQVDLGATQLSLPVIAEGIRYESAEVVDGAVKLRFVLEKTRLAL
ncbi:MAG TPA: DUF2993 domain-containing protein [Actinomycetota bacterium]|nr:DUF2993 domain-containing protein [Actinomycetota bacterium]